MRLRSATAPRADHRTVQIEQVECVVEQPVLTARGEVGVQQPEIRNALRIRDDRLLSRIRSFEVDDLDQSGFECERSNDQTLGRKPPPSLHGGLTSRRRSARFSSALASMTLFAGGVDVAMGREAA
jgi:hypothetical protein